MNDDTLPRPAIVLTLSVRQAVLIWRILWNVVIIRQIVSMEEEDREIVQDLFRDMQGQIGKANGGHIGT